MSQGVASAHSIMVPPYAVREAMLVVARAISCCWVIRCRPPPRRAYQQCPLSDALSTSHSLVFAVVFRIWNHAASN